MKQTSNGSLHMALQAKQTIQQRLMLAPNVTLALEVLRMPTMELQAYLQQQAEENPLLEVDESQDEEQEEALAETNGAEESPVATLDEEWLSHWNQGGADEEEEGENRKMEQRLVRPQSLHESLRMQLGCQPLSEEQRRLGETIINHLDEHGYLEGTLEELAAELAVALPQTEAALKIVQRFDPLGVGARNLRECLMIQLEQTDACGSLAYQILKDHFQLFVQHRCSAIASDLNVSVAAVEEACGCLKRLNPKPGRIFSGDLPPSIVPDLIITRRERHYDVDLNDQGMPRVGINRSYHRMLKDPNTPEEAKEFLLKKFRQANWIVKAIDERNATLMAIGRCLISLQRDFVEQGPKALKPLTQASVASLIGRHASTVSRAIAGKSIDTPYGVFRLEQLFASSVSQGKDSNGDAHDDVSDATIKSEIEHLVTEEDVRRPLSDEALAQRLAQRNITVARRTIAKYRTSLRILPAHLRKRRAN
ncbi:MAG: RNA polymerase factor sigma-54 [Candidatus Omnitrophota bacterium]|nr:RNA polymerase factor sigma-54 [Candidatus Omnitrophota bacterium]